MKLIILITYAVVATIYVAGMLFFGLRKMKKRFKNNEPIQHYITIIKQTLSTTKSGQFMKRNYFNWYTVSFIGIPLFIIISQFVFPLSALSYIKEFILGKSKLQKEAEAEGEKIDEANKRAEDFMKNEGCCNNFECN